MKATERDALLIRLDEKVSNIYHLTERQESHLSKLNDAVLNNAIQTASNRVSIRWIKLILISSGVLGGVGGGIAGLINWLG